MPIDVFNVSVFSVYVVNPAQINFQLLQCCYSIILSVSNYLLSDSPLPAVVQAVDLSMRLLQVELVSHRRGDLREVNFVSNLKYSYL